MTYATTYLNYPGACRQAMTYYQQCLGGDLQLMAFPDEKGQPSSDPQAKLMHSQLTCNGKVVLMASDCAPGTPLQMGNHASVMLECESAEEIEKLFASLSEGGKVQMPLDNMFWGARFGAFTDKFGVQWMLNYTLPPK